MLTTLTRGHHFVSSLRSCQGWIGLGLRPGRLDPATKFRYSLASMELSAPLRRHQALVAEFIRFGLVGTVGYLADTAVVYALKGLIGPGPAGMPSFLVAATVTWWLNRAWTWKGRGGTGSRLRQWAHFLAVSSPGLVLNRGVYEALIFAVPLCAAYPFLATGAGTLAGMFVNFGLSRKLVFR